MTANISRTLRFSAPWLLLSFCLAFFCTTMSQAQPLPRFDFTKPDDVKGWMPTHDVAPLEPTAEGLLIRLTGPDPYIVGPPRDYPTGQLLWLRLRLKSDQEGTAQLFYFDRTPSEEASVRFPVRGGVWEDLRIPFPSLGPGYRLRLDPPGSRGQAILASLSFDPRAALAEPTWPKPQPPALAPDSPTIRSAELLLTHAPGELGGFTLTVADQPVAIGFNRPLIGYVTDGRQRWLDLHQRAKVTVEREQQSLLVTAAADDPDGAAWQITQRFSVAPSAGAINVHTQVTADKDRDIVFLPMLVLLPGVGSFGQSKTQALFPGLEYLDKDEPSSSEADIIGPGSKRQVPDSLKITFPLMCVLANGRYIGLIWEQDPSFSALFDSPDRLFQSAGHVMGLLFPGSNGHNRVEGSLLPHAPQTLAAAKPLNLRATIIAGKGASIIPAVRHYVSLRPLPPAPDIAMDAQGYISLASAGWLDSEIRQGNRYRHAYPGSFPPVPAADAAIMMDWLARRTTDMQLAQRLSDAAKAALAEVNPRDYNTATVSHVRFPVGSLLYGHVPENAARARQAATDLLKRFEPDGAVRYRPSGKADYGKTHFAPDANGLTAQVVLSLLVSAAVSGDEELIAQALRHLRALDKFADTVPRGAQTWECPLHTPDILASANLVHAYAIGYELTGQKPFLDMARYWAWTGVPFVYLTNPTSQHTGPYATIPVLGATNWVAPNWMGLPVQWCGLVYADALYELHAHDPTGPWQQIADGITASGIQQTFPANADPERRGLLPDSFALRTGQRNDPAINPGTVQANAVRLFRHPPLYSFHAFRSSGLLLHAPGRLSELREEPAAVSFKVQPALGGSYSVLISSCKKPPRIRINGAQATDSTYDYDPDRRWLILHLNGDAAVELN
jgi:hypothetical protein